MNQVQATLSNLLSSDEIAALDGYECAYCGSKLNSGRCFYKSRQHEKRSAEDGDCSKAEMFLRAAVCSEQINK